MMSQVLFDMFSARDSESLRRRSLERIEAVPGAVYLVGRLGESKPVAAGRAAKLCVWGLSQFLPLWVPSPSPANTLETPPTAPQGAGTTPVRPESLCSANAPTSGDWLATRSWTHP